LKRDNSRAVSVRYEAVAAWPVILRDERAKAEPLNELREFPRGAKISHD
jgi:hypothetical protein